MTIYRAKFRKYYVFLITDYDIYANYKPILLYLLVLLMVCVITQLIYSFLVWVIIHEMLVNCGWDSVLWLLYLVYVLYVMHLSPSIMHDLVFYLALWSFYPLVYKMHNQNPKKPFFRFYFMRLCWLVIL